jgi:hypothetical protein
LVTFGPGAQGRSQASKTATDNNYLGHICSLCAEVKAMSWRGQRLLDRDQGQLIDALVLI